MSEGRFSPVCFLSAAVSAEFLIKANEEKKKNLFAHLNLLLPIVCEH